MVLDASDKESDQDSEHNDHLDSQIVSTTESSEAVHGRLSELSTSFHLLQEKLINEPGPEQGEALQQSAQSLMALCEMHIDQMVIQDVVRNHNVASENPSKDALMMRTPFIYAGIALPQNRAVKQQAIDNPSREFA